MGTARRSVEFWSAATGVTYVPGAGPDAPGDLIGEVEGMGIALCPVPEPKTVKDRVHLDLHTDSVDTLLALGATRAPGYDNPEDSWTVLLDPEGNELCAFVRDEVPAYKVSELTVDAADPQRIARWWADVFGVEAGNEGQALLVDRGRARDAVRVHALRPGPGAQDGQEPHPLGRLRRRRRSSSSRGATVLEERPRWTVLADPEGNEFCVFA